MADTEPNLKYNLEILKQENDSNPSPSTKRVLLYGWNPDTLEKVRVKVDSNGLLGVTIDG